MYKRLVAAIAVLGLLASAAPAAASVQDFTITSFTADYYLSRDGANVSQMRVRERIVARFPDFDQNHGILRAIPESYDGHGLELAIRSVQKQSGESWQYTTYTENNNLVLKIGDPDVYAHGTNTYIIEYDVRGPINVQDGHRLFWDVNGDQWPQRFGLVTARVHLPSDLADAYKDEGACFTGSFGSTQSDCSTTTDKQDNTTVVTIRTARPLQPYETLTFDMRFAQGTFAPYSMSAGKWAEMIGLTVLLATPTFVALFFVIRAWRRYGRDAKGRGVIVPQYIPPKGVSVLSSNAVLHQTFQPKAISATIIDLAVRHYLKVYETGKKMFGTYTYDIEVVKKPAGLLPEEAVVLEMLFGAESVQVGTRVSLDKLSKTLYTKAQKIGEDVQLRLTADGYFVRVPHKVRVPYLVWGTVLVAVGFIFPPYTLGLIAAGIICFIGAAIMPAPTVKGAVLKEYVLGLKMYMQLAEAERLKVLQSPQGALTQKVDAGDKGQLITLYERLLPYAMLFGIEKQWAKQFADLYDQSPDWYSGTRTFNAVYFASAVHSLGTTVTQSFAPPSSSSSGAGGGGGGGGGGGW